MKNILLATLLIGILSTLAILHISFAEAVSCSGDCTPPTLGITDNGRRVVENGFTINGVPFNVESFSQTIPTQVFLKGDRVTIKITGYENSGIGNVRHVTLAIGKVMNNKEADIKAKITTERSFTGQVSQNIADPTGLLDRVTVTSKGIDSFTGSMTISFVVKKPFDTSDIIIRMWDAGTSSSINVFEDAIQVVGEKPTALKETSEGKMTASTEKAANLSEAKVKKKMEGQEKMKEEKIKSALEKAKKPYIGEGTKKKKLPQHN